MAGWFITALLFGGFILLCLIGGGSPVNRRRGCSGRNESMYYNRTNGQYRVRYPEGYYSQPFCYDVAKDYAEMFGGVVVSVNEYHPRKD